MMPPRDVRIAGSGMYLPGPALDQEVVRAFLTRFPDKLSAALQDRILTSSGIKKRYFAADAEKAGNNETNATMAAKAGKQALESAQWSPDEVELLIVSTVVPDYLIPPTSVFVQEALDIRRCAEIEVSANCTAPFKAVMIASDAIARGRCHKVLVCMSQLASVLTNPPWANAELMEQHYGALRWVVSDGAVALALEGVPEGMGLQAWTESAGVSKAPGMFLPFGSANPDFRKAFLRGDHHVRQNDRSVLKVGIPLAVEALRRMLTVFHIDPQEIRFFIPGIVSLQLADRLQPIFESALGISANAWCLDLADIGYLGGVGPFATIHRLIREDQLAHGDLVCAFVEESSKWMAAGIALRWH